MWRIVRRRIPDPGVLFNGPYIDARKLYLLEYGVVCSISFINEIDGGQAQVYLLDQLAAEVAEVHQFSTFDHEAEKMGFVVTIIVLKGCRMIELGPNYCELLYRQADLHWAKSLMNEIVRYKVVTKATPIGFARQLVEN